EGGDLEALALEALDDLSEPLGVGPEHRAAAPDRPAVAVDPDDVDVGGALGHAFLEDLRPLVDHRVEGALDDLLIADLAGLAARLGPEVVDDLRLPRGRGGAALLVIIVEAPPLPVAG